MNWMGPNFQKLVGSYFDDDDDHMIAKPNSFK